MAKIAICAGVSPIDKFRTLSIANIGTYLLP
nr:hypothetical protein HmN_000500500 [Hymenolepis microstoma]